MKPLPGRQCRHLGQRWWRYRGRQIPEMLGQAVGASRKPATLHPLPLNRIGKMGVMIDPPRAGVLWVEFPAPRWPLVSPTAAWRELTHLQGQHRDRR